MNTDTFILHVKGDDIAHVEIRFDTSNYEIDRLLPMGKNKQGIGLMKNESGGQIMKKLLD